MQNSAIRRIVVVGLDGATWDIIDPMIKQGLLPNFQKIIQQGVRGNLRSLKLTTSPRVWTSIATGKTEEKHGIYNFRNNIGDLKTKRIWNIFAEAGERVSIFYWYLTWPPQEDVNGFMVPGFLARDSQTVPKELSFLKEIELSEKMRFQESGKTSGLPFYLRSGYRALRNGVKFSTMIRVLKYLVCRLLKKNDELESFYQLQLIKLHLFGDVFNYILKNNPTELSMILFPQPDQLGHKFWAFMEADEYEKRTGSHISNKLRTKYGNVIYNLYKEFDKIVGEIDSKLSNDDVLIIVSDHGFGLVEKSYASLKIKGNQFLRMLQLDKIADAMTVGINFIIKINDNNSNINIQEVSKTIADIQTTDDNETLFKVTHTQNEIILELKNIFSMYLDDANSFLKKNLKIGEQIIPAKELLVNRSDITGEHRDIGVLIMKGRHISKNKTINKASVLDVVPTILYLKKMPVARDMDGTILKEAFDPEFVKGHPDKYIETYESDTRRYYDQKADFSMTEELEVRLKDLGYLD
ncbi:MAG: alkaline phosphatase family protein [bacterium]|nr:alkaline phosphatase family protein [bacterium]